MGSIRQHPTSFVSRVSARLASVFNIPRPLTGRTEHATKRQLRCDADEENMMPMKRARTCMEASDAKQETIPATVATVPTIASQFAQQAAPRVGTSLKDIEAIVVNLDRRPDRMEGCARKLQEHCPWLPFERFSACDGKTTRMSEKEVVLNWNTAKNVVYQKKRSIRKGWDDLESYHVLDLQLSPGERGCAISHIRAWESCLARAGSTNKPLLVLEDDAAPTPDFTERLERAMADVPADAHLLYVGYSQAAEWKREVSRDVVESEYVWTTVGYVVWPAGARLLLNRLPVDGPVDNWMAQAAADGDINAYCVRPKIVRQADAWNTNSDVGHSDEQYWGPCSDIHHSDDFYWGNPASTGYLTGPPDSANNGSSAARDNGLLVGGCSLWDLSDDSEGSSDL